MLRPCWHVAQPPPFYTIGKTEGTPALAARRDSHVLGLRPDAAPRRPNGIRRAHWRRGRGGCADPVCIRRPQMTQTRMRQE